MALEIERKFLVLNDDFKKEAFSKKLIIQGFLNSDKNSTVRVRLLDDKAFITIKGKSSQDGLVRYEWEKEIELNEANELLLLCEEHVIKKHRYYIKQGENTYEVDVFSGRLEGLIVAEIELEKTDSKYEKPSWIGEEVTGKIEYYNSVLSKRDSFL